MNAQYKDILPFDLDELFLIKNETDFNYKALRVFHFQYKNNAVYHAYCTYLKVDIDKIDHYTQIPFLPISFFKTQNVVAFKEEPEIVFSSSGTTGEKRSLHSVKAVSIYEKAFMQGFELRFGAVEDYVVLGLLPSYLERDGSSLIYMVEKFIQKSNHQESGFFLDEYEKLHELIRQCAGKKILLIGVTYALLDFGAQCKPDLSKVLIMETGGMKGKRKEMIKSELHAELSSYFSNPEIHSEYGMTELLSQGYSKGLNFSCPPWMKVLTRAYTDPFELIEGKTGGINIIDLANVFSCSFIATQDLGRVQGDTFEIIGRFDHADIRGCNLLVQ